MSQSQHKSQDDLRAIFGDESEELQKSLRIIQVHEEKTAAQRVSVRTSKGEKTELRPVVILVDREFSFCHKRMHAYLVARLKGVKNAIVKGGNNKEVHFYRDDESWHMQHLDGLLVRGTRGDMVYAVSSDMALSFRDEHK